MKNDGSDIEVAKIHAIVGNIGNAFGIGIRVAKVLTFDLN